MKLKIDVKFKDKKVFFSLFFMESFKLLFDEASLNPRDDVLLERILLVIDFFCWKNN